MADMEKRREQVIEMLNDLHAVACGLDDRQCYVNGMGISRLRALIDEATAVLRAEAPRIITAEDFRENPAVDEHGFLPAWVECDEVETERGELVGVISKGETLDGWTEVSLDDMPGRPGHNPHVRYWTGRPGKELMGKVKW